TVSGRTERHRAPVGHHDDSLCIHSGEVRARGTGRLSGMRVLAAPDKFRGTAHATQVAAAIGEAAWGTGWECVEVPFSDGGEGLLDVFGGANRTTEVHDPLGRIVQAP